MSAWQSMVKGLHHFGEAMGLVNEIPQYPWDEDKLPVPSPTAMPTASPSPPSLPGALSFQEGLNKKTGQ